MASDDSDDEPLALIVEKKKTNPEKFAVENVPTDEEVRRRKRKRAVPVKRVDAIAVKARKRIRRAKTPEVVERPSDVWLYLKELNPLGPYTCLLCSEWFINKSKLVIHYVLNHRKDFCGICKYFVPDREAWIAHEQFHRPWPCSQCILNFLSEKELRQHLSSAHNLVHCRLCHFRITDDDQYNTHLLQKHSITNISSKDEEVLWDFEFEGSAKYSCLLCSKSNNANSSFFNHFIGYHRFTLKCFANIISGRDPPFLISGADLSPEFIDAQLKTQVRYGYVDSDPNLQPKETTQVEPDINAFIPEVKQEVVSDVEDEEGTNKNVVEHPNSQESELVKSYKGDEDFDLTAIEVIVLEQCYYDYVDGVLNNLDEKTVSQNSDIDYDKSRKDDTINVDCGICKMNCTSVQSYINHMTKMHILKHASLFSCRVCATAFDSQNELDNHITQELGDFEDLWLCQFCDKEFNNRAATRKHLSEHWDVLDPDNCFSPHLGFKCRYCPTLFWNETDREYHQVTLHLNRHKEEFYKCISCNEMFSDKVWFTHHFIEKHVETTPPVSVLKCSLCCVVLMSIDEMRTHFSNSHPDAKKLYCSLETCKYKPFSNKKSFRLHLRSIHDPATRGERSVTCALCDREFATARACSGHMTQVHGPGKFKCKVCKEALHTLDERKLHYLLRHPGRHPYECTECGKSFQYKSSLYMHKQEHAPNKTTYCCNTCGKSFVKKDSFREHLQIHEGPRHACSYCPMRFVQRSNMLRHERRHTGERPYQCAHCPRTFADKGACTSHSRTHSKVTPFSCVYCGQTFVQKSKLTYHIRRHTGENLETCTVCSKLFTSGCSLREHMKIHDSKDKLVKCPLCNKQYRDERYMLRHLRTSHAAPQLGCPLCGKALASAQGLRHHVLTHSALNPFRCKVCPKTYAVKRTMIKHLRKRHNLKGTEINIHDFFKRLDPRECNLGIDEVTMTQIFGVARRKVNDLLIGDYVTFPDHVQNPTGAERDGDSDSGTGEEDKAEDYSEFNKYSHMCGTEVPIEHSVESFTIKVERKSESGSDQELEPTDFVSVKVEPMDSDAEHEAT